MTCGISIPEHLVFFAGVILRRYPIPHTTVCPEVGDTFDTPCFSEVGAPIHEIFYVVIVGSGTFRLVYNSAWFWVIGVRYNGICFG